MKQDCKDKVKKILEDVDCQRISVDDALQAIEKAVDSNLVDALCGVGDILSRAAGGGY